MNDTFQIPAQLTNMQSLKDKTWRMTFHTAELGTDTARLMEWIMQQGWLVFNPNKEISQEDIPEATAVISDSEKSPSQRLRNVLYVLWVQRGKPESWEVWYTKQMDRFIETIKDKLEPED